MMNVDKESTVSLNSMCLVDGGNVGMWDDCIEGLNTCL